MAMDSSERVLVVPTEIFRGLGYFQGFAHETARYLPELFDRRHVSYLPRSAVEDDPRYKQLIPYVIFRHVAGGVDWLFRYTRGTGQGEQRLHRKRSVGVGGHISADDAESGLPGDAGTNPYEQGLWRELSEEVRIEARFTHRLVGLINDDQTEVGKVHLGIVHICDVCEPAVHPREAEIAEAGFRPVSEILEELESFETWSQICVRALFGGTA